MEQLFERVSEVSPFGHPYTISLRQAKKENAAQMQRFLFQIIFSYPARRLRFTVSSDVYSF